MKVNYDIQISEVNGQRYIGVNDVDFPANPNQNVTQQIVYAIWRFNDYFDAQNGTYNKAVYWPKWLEEAINSVLDVRYDVYATAHCRNRIQSYGLPQGCFTAMLYGEVVEAECHNGNITKIVTRLPNRKNTNQDICAAILLEHNDYGHKASVKTIWLNQHDDMHGTIDRKNYVENFEDFS